MIDTTERVISIDSKADFSLGLLRNFIDRHRVLSKKYYDLRDMYKGKHLILLKNNNKPIYKPDNRLVVNHAKYIVDTLNGFFTGIPIKTIAENPRVNDYIQEFDRYNNIDDLNSEIAKKCSIYGRCYELLFIDERSKVGATYMDPMDAFIIYDNSIRQKPLFGIRYTRDKEGVLIGTFSDDAKIYYFRSNDKGELIIDQEEPHYFKAVPMVEYVENEELQGAFENVETLINAYNKAISEKANDVDYFADAYMAILGALLEEKDIINIKNNRIINIEPIADSQQLEVKFLEKPNADTTQENLIDRLEKLIFNISMVANINDENFGTSSGIALKYKLQSMSNLSNVKERKFVKGLNKRFELIANVPNTPIGEDDLKNIKYIFTRNIPNNTAEEAQTAAELIGITSKETALSTLSIVDDVKKELDLIKEEEGHGDHDYINYMDSLEDLDNEVE